jgi:hypothetical protein
MNKITPEHLSRDAYVYVRQSTPDQLLNNPESRRRQYALETRARALGWENVIVIDEDLGRSGGGAARPGFERLLAAICAGTAGAVGEYVIVPGGPPMHLTATGTETRRERLVSCRSADRNTVPSFRYSPAARAIVKTPEQARISFHGQTLRLVRLQHNALEAEQPHASLAGRIYQVELRHVGARARAPVFITVKLL